MDERAAASATPERDAAIPPTPDEPHSGEAPAAPIEPEEIRAIRKRLGLSQAEAGKLLGGGPRAFTKYEAGTVKPAIPMRVLLRLLVRNPHLIEQIRDPKSPPMTPSLAPPSPFQISGEHIERFNQQLFPELLRHLLHAEAHASRLPADGIHVSSNVTAPDGGEDGRIEWRGGVGRTPHLPCRLNQFQLKAGRITPAKAGEDVLQGRQVKPMVRKVLEDGGHYRMLCAHRYTRKAIESRTRRILEAVQGAGVPVNDSQITFWGAEQIADWANQHPTVAIWAKEHTQPGVVRPFCSWTRWASHPDHDDSPWVPDERLPRLQAGLRELATPQSVLRLVGLSGIGKSRLVLEALGRTAGDLALRDLVMYADGSRPDMAGICRVVETLADTGSYAIVVVNRCSQETHRTLAAEIVRASSRLSLLTIDDEVPATSLDEDTIEVDDAPQAVVDAIIGRIAPNLPPDDRRRLEHFSVGFPRIAIDVSKAWRSSRPIPHTEGDDIVNTFVLGRNRRNPEHLLKSAMLLAAFDGVAVGGDYEQLKEAASFSHDLSFEDLRTGINRLVERGVVRRKGRLRVLQPLPIAMRLAERQWQDWPETVWERLLASDRNPQLRSLRTAAAGMLARLNQTPTADEVVRHMCRPTTPLCQPDVMPALAEVVPGPVLQAVDSFLSKIDDLSELVGADRRHVVFALKRIVFHEATFDGAARLLLRLAAAETEQAYSNSATGAFVSLFRILLGDTAADGDVRLAFLDDVMDNAGADERPIVVEALIGSLAPTGYRMVDAEVQGSIPVLSPWFPQTKEAKIRYVTGCLSRLASIATREHPDWPTGRARSGLAQRLRPWVSQDYMDVLEKAVHQVSSSVGVWPEAIESLGRAQKYDARSHSPEISKRLEALLRYLRPENLDDRIQLIVTAMPWHYPTDEGLNMVDRQEKQEEAIQSLALDLARAPRVLEEALPRLCRGEQRNAFIFGVTLSDLSDRFKPNVWCGRITRATLAVPDAERNLSLLSGYFAGIAGKFPELAVPLKEGLTQSTALAWAFPTVCSRLGVTKSDVSLALQALERGTLTPAAVRQWSFGGALKLLSPSEVAPLIAALLAREGDEAFAVTLDLIGTYGLSDPDKLDGLHPQVRMCVSRCAQGGGWPAWANASYYFEELVGWLLAKGRLDADACETARDLAGIVVERSRAVGGEVPRSVIRKLLRDFPEVVWPSIGAAIVADQGVAWAMSFTLGKMLEEGPPIISLPAETLFSWCRAHPDAAPAFVAGVLPILAKEGDENVLHPMLRRLIDEFGGRDDVLTGIENNIDTYSWGGSMAGYYRQYIGPLDALSGHSIPAVRRWAARMTREMHACIEQARDEDAEAEARRGI